MLSPFPLDTRIFQCSSKAYVVEGQLSLEYDSPWQIAVRKAFPLLSYVGILISTHNSMNQRHRERGFEGFGPIPFQTRI